ncbi:hypothetical protein AGMMS50239_22680 [Bacteroidia bacterium]|nr:hypothetical protein AGMMS50239_22680 [Bacteroidia bacterium]
MKKNLIAVILLFTFFSLELKAQESVNAGGGDIKSSDIVISYSVGQVFVEPVAYPEGSLTPGIQQVYKISLITGLPDVITKLKMQAYPNPATDYLELSFPEFNKAKHTLSLIDQTGRTVINDEVKSEISRLEVQGLASGVYFLQIADKEQIVKVFKIIKK